MGTLRVSVVGGTGYAGAELCALLRRHPRVRIDSIHASGRHAAATRTPSGSGGGAPGDGAPPGPDGRAPGGTASLDVLSLERLEADPPDCVFLATPNEVSAALVPGILDAGVRVIDLSGAFRLRREADYPEWYGFPHPRPALLDEAVYGLTEWRGADLADRRLVANPGCYATAALLGLKPILPILDRAQPVICDAKSGVSGAGRRTESVYSFAELSGNAWAYGAAGHRHDPEIRQEAPIPDGAPFEFVPHVLPIVRGLMATLYVSFAGAVEPGEVAAHFAGVYGDAPLVRVRQHGELPDIRSVAGTPRAEIGFTVRPGGRRAVVVSVIDNLLKGAASQAVQNFNAVFGLDPMEGVL